jgi:hypothetical protein
MDDAADIFARLAAPFPPERVSWRVGSTTQDKTRGMALAYVDARDVQDRLTEVMGCNWQNRYVPMPNGTMCCEIGLLIDGAWIWRANGAGQTDFEAEKGAYSDAFKRAGVMWGVARYLYDLDSPWVEIEQRGRTAVIKKAEYAKLEALLARKGAPQKSARQAHEDGDYTRLETALREAKTMKALAAVWKAAQETIVLWPDRWIEAAKEEKDACKAKLEGDDPRKARAASQAPLQDQGESRA